MSAVQKLKKQYYELLNSGMFWEEYPKLSGNWFLDKEEWSKLNKEKSMSHPMDDDHKFDGNILDFFVKEIKEENKNPLPILKGDQVVVTFGLHKNEKGWVTKFIGDDICCVYFPEDNTTRTYSLEHLYSTGIKAQVTDLPKKTETTTEPYDMINPSHYKDKPIETIDKMIRVYGFKKTAWYCEIAAFKYRERMGDKPGQSIEQEMKKVKWYEKVSRKLMEYEDKVPGDFVLKNVIDTY